MASAPFHIGLVGHQPDLLAWKHPYSVVSEALSLHLKDLLLTRLSTHRAGLHVHSGMAQGADRLWIDAALGLKADGHKVRVTAHVPALTHSRPRAGVPGYLRVEQRRWWEQTLDAADDFADASEVLRPSDDFDPVNTSLVHRVKELVVVYVHDPSSSTAANAKFVHQQGSVTITPVHLDTVVNQHLSR